MAAYEGIEYNIRFETNACTIELSRQPAHLSVQPTVVFRRLNKQGSIQDFLQSTKNHLSQSTCEYGHMYAHQTKATDRGRWTGFGPQICKAMQLLATAVCSSQTLQQQTRKHPSVPLSRLCQRLCKQGTTPLTDMGLGRHPIAHTLQPVARTHCGFLVACNRLVPHATT